MNRRRLVNAAWGASEVAHAAVAVSGADCEGIVDGVIVDFRHPALPAGEWYARPNWHIWPAGNSQCGFAFPSVAAYIRQNPGLVEPGEELPDLIYLAHAGDRLIVTEVHDKISDRRFDHVHDATVKLANLVLEKATGERVASPWPLPFYGATQLRDGPQIDAYDRLINRVLAEHGNPDLDRFEDKQLIGREDGWPAAADMTLSQRALCHAGEAERALDRLRTFIESTGDQAAMASLRSFARSTALLGFFQAKNELRRAEQIGEASTRNLSLGPKALRNTGWHDFATPCWEAEPARTRSSIFKEMVAAGAAHDDERRSVLRSLKKHPLCPPGD